MTTTTAACWNPGELKQHLLGYGCQGYLFHPPFTLLSSDPHSKAISHNPQYVLKVMPYRLARREKRVRNRLYEVDPQRNHFLSFEVGFEYRLPLVQLQALAQLSSKLHDAPSIHVNEDDADAHDDGSRGWYAFPIRYGGIVYRDRLQSFLGNDWLTMMHDCMTLLESLSKLHDQGHIVHRDIKSTNVVFHPRTEQVRLIDFGLALPLDDDMLSRMSDCKFEIWSIELNARASEFRVCSSSSASSTTLLSLASSSPSSSSLVGIVGDAIWTWLQTDARQWSLWFDYWKRSDAEETRRWYRQYIDEFVGFWQQESQEQRQQQPHERLTMVAQMLRQNDVLQIGLLFLDFLTHHYVPSFGHPSEVPRSTLLSQWMDNILVPMIHPDYRVRMSLSHALDRHRQLLRVAQQAHATVHRTVTELSVPGPPNLPPPTGNPAVGAEILRTAVPATTAAFRTPHITPYITPHPATTTTTTFHSSLKPKQSPDESKKPLAWLPPSYKLYAGHRPPPSSTQTPAPAEHATANTMVTAADSAVAATAATAATASRPMEVSLSPSILPSPKHKRTKTERAIGPPSASVTVPLHLAPPPTPTTTTATTFAPIPPAVVVPLQHGATVQNGLELDLSDLLSQIEPFAMQIHQQLSDSDL